jgi:arsenate reductase (glutaredoxin)
MWGGLALKFLRFSIFIWSFMIKGTVKFFNNAKGFGFITPDDGGKDVFLPSAAITASGTAPLKAGQRVSFEHEPDVKGPKVVKLKLLDDKPEFIAVARASSITIYHDPSSVESADVLSVLRAAGHEPQLIDYIVTPPSGEELKRLSLLLGDSDQTLVRRYDPLFLELQLDDRFIGESEFWTAIVEHPSLINGPLFQEANRVRICKTPSDVRAFLGLEAASEPRKKSRGISPRIVAMMQGLDVPPLPAREESSVEKVVRSIPADSKAKSPPPPRSVKASSAAKKAVPALKKVAVKSPRKSKIGTAKKKTKK